MMTRLREEFDADRIRESEPTDYKTGENRFELLCGVCGRTLYADRPTFEHYENAIRHDPDNQFTCADCEREYEDLAHG